MSILRTAILFHEPPNEPAHYDWLVECAPKHPLACWRVERPIDALAMGERIDAQRINDHRPRWLNLTAPEPLSRSRGVVSPYKSGLIQHLHTEPKTWLLTIEWDSGIRATYRLLAPSSPKATLCRVEETSL